MNTPKESFLTGGQAETFKKIVGSEAFVVACDYALMELQHQMPPTNTPGLPTDPYVAIDANSQMWGARRAIEILKTLSEPIKQPTAPKQDRLHY